MNTSVLRASRAIVLGLFISFPVVLQAQYQSGSSTEQVSQKAQQLFEKGSNLIKRDQISEGLRFLKQAAEQGHGRAAFELASLYEVGLAVKKSYSKAKKYYEQSVKQGYRDAHFNLALLLSNPDNSDNNLKRARDLVEVIASNGDIEAQFLLANLMNMRLSSVGKKPGKSFYWLQHAANSGHAKAQLQLGAQYLKGGHVSRSTKNAEKWFKRAAMQNVAEAHYNLGRMYEKGDGVLASSEVSAHWYDSAAELGNAEAQQSMGIRYLMGDNVKQDTRKALNFLSLAGKSGLVKSQMLLGQLYQAGYEDKIDVNIVMAEKWYSKAAEEGVPEAQFQLAMVLLEKNNRELDAVRWIKRAAAQGHAGAITFASAQR